MPQAQLRPSGDRPLNHEQAEELLAQALSAAGWNIQRPRGGRGQPDLLIRRGDISYAIEMKIAAEGRSDRLIALWSQALVQVAHFAGDEHRHLAVVVAPSVRPRVAENVLEFAAEYAPCAGAGVMDSAGLRRFQGAGLEDLDAEPAELPHLPRSARGGGGALFTDLNQWLLKVLLAPEIPDHLMSAPRERYANASELARAARVSVMTAFRFVERLRNEGYLDESARKLILVRRAPLLEQWRASAARRVREIPIRFLLRGDGLTKIGQALEGERACLALFTAADALGFGFVRGVPPYVYVARISAVTAAGSKRWSPAEPGETPDVILRDAWAPNSIFRAMVPTAVLPASDVLQVWLDVSADPARGHEQAELIQRKVLGRIIA